MMLLIVAVLFGIGFTYLATQNAALVTLQLASYTLPQVPLYLVILGTFLLALFLAWFLASIGWVSSFLTIRSKEGKIRETERMVDSKDETIAALRDKIKELSLENAQLRGDKKVVRDEVKNDETVEEEKQATELRPGLLTRLRHISL